MTTLGRSRGAADRKRIPQVVLGRAGGAWGRAPNKSGGDARGKWKGRRRKQHQVLPLRRNQVRGPGERCFSLPRQGLRR